MKTTYIYTQLDPTVFDTYFSGVEKAVAVDLFIKISNIFLKNIGPRIQLLSLSLMDQKNHEAIIVAHQIKGSLLSIGGTKLADIFRQIETGINIIPNTELSKLMESETTNLEIFAHELKNRMQQLQES